MQQENDQNWIRPGRHRLLEALFLQMCVVLPCAADVYQCVASDGAKVYSDAPCDPASKPVKIQERRDATFGQPQIETAEYASPRNGRALDIAGQLKSACDRRPDSCLLHCGNQLAGDPDFGQTKYCKVSYHCAEGILREAQISEGGSINLSCSTRTEAVSTTHLDPPHEIATNSQAFNSGLSAPVTRSAMPAAAAPSAYAVGAAAAYAQQQKAQASIVFVDYVLSVYWQPTLCSDNPKAEQCRTISHNGWVLDGLWPHKDFASPVRCAVNLPVPDSVVQFMADLLPTRALVEHEWSEHGSCTGLDPRQYFQTVRRAFGMLKWPSLSNKNARPQRRTFNIQDIQHELSIAQDNVVCSNENPARFQGVRYCFTQNLDAESCSGDIIMSSCRSVNMEVPPAN